MNELNVKVGDKVLVRNSAKEYIAIVSKVTPTGRIKTDRTGDTQFDKYGRQMGGDIWYKSYIRIPSEEDCKRLKEMAIKRKALNLMNTYNMDNISVEQAEQIIAILDIIA